MGLTKELGRVAGVGEELRVWFCVFSQMVQLRTAAKGWVWVPQTSCIAAAFLAADSVTVCCRVNWVVGFLLNLYPKKVKFYT